MADRSRRSARGPHHVADLDIRLRWGQFNMFLSITFISSLERGKVYSQIGWGHFGICLLGLIRHCTLHSNVAFHESKIIAEIIWFK